MAAFRGSEPETRLEDVGIATFVGWEITVIAIADKRCNSGTMARVV